MKYICGNVVGLTNVSDVGRFCTTPLSGIQTCILVLDLWGNIQVTTWPGLRPIPTPLFLPLLNFFSPLINILSDDHQEKMFVSCSVIFIRKVRWTVLNRSRLKFSHGSLFAKDLFPRCTKNMLQMVLPNSRQRELGTNDTPDGQKIRVVKLLTAAGVS